VYVNGGSKHTARDRYIVASVHNDYAVVRKLVGKFRSKGYDVKLSELYPVTSSSAWPLKPPDLHPQESDEESDIGEPPGLHNLHYGAPIPHEIPDEDINIHPQIEDPDGDVMHRRPPDDLDQDVIQDQVAMPDNEYRDNMLPESDSDSDVSKESSPLGEHPRRTRRPPGWMQSGDWDV
jgi:hypothetical protein